MGEMTTSMQFLSDKVDASNKLMDEIRKELALTKKENEGLLQQNVTLKKEVVDMQERMRNLEQYSRKNNIEISGIPTTPNEHVNDIVKDLGSALGVEILPAQIAAGHRIPSFSKARAPAVVVKFHDRAVKENLLAKFREARRRSAHLTADKINKAFPPNKVYVNDHLAPENKQFLAKLKQKCQEVGYVFVWCRDGKFFIKKNADSKVQKVSTLAVIENIK
ncbi:uncharacterized protein LOC124363518 [Homalodisca vitripennis]|uniref:uncharacterized protein LOC124363518 n=1 Tax=Homalodisca vitripennis TaxID=197043 RepID=UPI001EECA6B6|nr:uncharacterized protein LOC124363518 [Homalodisca vitripennis]